MNQPMHIICIVTESKDPNEKKICTRSGLGSRIRMATGFDLMIHDQLSVSGGLVCTEPREKTGAGEEPVEA
jgi:hypothetical protein